VLARQEDGSRHPQHVAGDSTKGKTDAELSAIYAPLNLGKVVDVDTEHFGEAEYRRLVERLKSEPVLT
jgi:hypothetical protein